MDFIAKFLTALVNGGIHPKRTTDIKPTNNRWGRMACADDKGSKRSISYKLTIEHDFAYGYAKDHKTGITLKFDSYNNDKNLSRADITRIKTMLKARQAAEEVLIAARHAKIAERAKVILGMAVASGTTPYLDRKKIGLNSARIIGDKVVIPVTEYGNNIVSWQMIRSDGTKKFPFGGKKKGCWHIIGQINPTESFYICEGFATGCTIHETTSAAVIVAFDAGNLLPVTKALRKIYTNTPIIIAADNDASGVGQKAAEAARKAISNCTVICPKNPDTDFNDDPSGLLPNGNTGKCPADGNLSPQGNSVQSIGGDWMDKLITDAKNRMLPHSLHNTLITLSHHDDWRGLFCYDEFKCGTMLMRTPPWSEKPLEDLRITDVHITQCASTLESYGLMMSRDKVAQAIEVVAQENKFHSAREYFKRLEWDGVYRLETMLFDHFGSTQEDERYLAFVAKKWMTAAIKRIMVPGCKFDHVLVMESAQGIAKSSALKCLVTFGSDERETYHTDAVSVGDWRNPHAMIKLQGSMFVELAELKGFSHQDDASIKNWITQQYDEIKLPYDRHTTRFPRQFVFAATTNKNDYLKDPTGNRRYWPFTVEKLIDLNKLADEREQLWAEAVWNWREGLYIGPTPEENELAEIERQKRLTQDPWEDKVMEIIAYLNKDKIKVVDILNHMKELKLTDKNELTARRVSSILQMQGFENKSIWNGITKMNERLWVRK